MIFAVVHISHGYVLIALVTLFFHVFSLSLNCLVLFKRLRWLVYLVVIVVGYRAVLGAQIVLKSHFGSRSPAQLWRVIIVQRMGCGPISNQSKFVLEIQIMNQLLLVRGVVHSVCGMRVFKILAILACRVHFRVCRNSFCRDHPSPSFRKLVPFVCRFKLFLVLVSVPRR